MAQGYRLVLKKNLSGKEGEPEKKVYAIPNYNSRTSLNKLCKLISARSTVSSADVKAVLDNLNFVLDMELQDGNIVQVGELGNFRLSISSEGAETKDKFTSSMVKKARVIFTPGSALRTTVETTDFEARNSGTSASGSEAEKPAPKPDENPDDL